MLIPLEWDSRLSKNHDLPVAKEVAFVDDIDRNILIALQLNGRLTMKHLADQIGLSSPALIDRVKRLEERGVITGYRAMVSAAAIGKPLSVFIAATTGTGDPGLLLQQLEQETAVAECHRVTGDHCWLIRVNLQDMPELESLLDRLGAVGATCTAEIVLSSPIEPRPLFVASDGTQPSGRGRAT